MQKINFYLRPKNDSVEETIVELHPKCIPDYKRVFECDLEFHKQGESNLEMNCDYCDLITQQS